MSPGPAPGQAVGPNGQPIYTGPPPGFGPGPGTPQSFAPSPAPGGLPSRPGPERVPSGAPALPIRPPGPMPEQRLDMNFRDKEEAEQAFMSLLRSKGVDVDWTWEGTMRAVITEPLYKALKTLAERKAAFQKYIEDLKRREHEERAARLERLRPAFKDLVAANEQIKSYSSFRTAQKLLGGNEVWKQAKNEEEARTIFEGITKEMKDKEAVSERDSASVYALCFRMSSGC